MKKIYLVAGEMSGDAHGAALMRAMCGRLEEAPAFGGVGGPKMKAVPGAERLVDWLAEAAVLGLWEVLKKYGYFRREFARVLEEIRAWQPDAVILIDYPGFNLRLAKALRREVPGVRIIYYISPQVWAWNRGRIPKMARMLDLMLCIFPFEKELYEASGLRTEFVGHPLVDELGAEQAGGERENGLVALLPGSRGREVEKHFPVMLEAAAQVGAKRPELRFRAAAASGPLREEMQRLLAASPLDEGRCEIGEGGTHDLMQRATCGVIASGTATLEAAFFGLPYCLIYRVSWATWAAAKMVVKVDHLGMANILAGREIVREFLQADATAANIARELERLSGSSEAREQVASDLRAAVGELGAGGAHERAADFVIAELS